MLHTDQITLADSLLTNPAWERNRFGYNGPYPPYVRIGLKWRTTLSFEACFESWIKDRLFTRTKISIPTHLSKYSSILLKTEAIEDTFGIKRSLEATPISNKWFKIEAIKLHSLWIYRPEFGCLEVAMHTLSPASQILLSKN